MFISRRRRLYLKHVVWKFGVGFLFARLVARKISFERHFKRAPRNLMLFPTNLCNAMCSFCAYPSNTDPKRSMPNEIAFKAIDDLMAMGGGEVVDFTTNVGDPLIDPRLADKLAYAKKKGARTTRFYTNGILLDRDGLIEKIAPNLDRLHVSIPGLNRQNYHALFRVDKAEKVLRGLKRLGEHKKRTGFPREIYIEIRANRPLDVVMQDAGMREIAPYFDAGHFKLGVTLTTFGTWGGTITQADMSGIMELQRSEAPDKSIPCGLLFVYPGVLPDGHVRACSCWYTTTNYDRLTLPSVMDRPLSEILFGDEHRAILADWLKGDMPELCAGCSNYEPAFFRLPEIAKMAVELVR